MKKLKGVVNMGSSESNLPHEDAQIRIKHQSLLQEYLQLHGETEAKRNKLQSTKEKKMTLMAEVRFLRGKFEWLIQNHSKKSLLEQPSAQAQLYPPPKPRIQGHYLLKQRNYGRKEAALRPQIKSLDYNKERIYSGKEFSSLTNPTKNFEPNQMQRNHRKNVAHVRNTIPNFDLNQKGKIYDGKEAVLRNPSQNLDSSQRIDKGKDVVTRKPVPAFDLNQVLGEEEEIQTNSIAIKVEPQKVLINGVMDEQQNDMKLLACRTIGTEPKRGGKRKISWQDQVALRV